MLQLRLSKCSLQAGGSKLKCEEGTHAMLRCRLTQDASSSASQAVCSQCEKAACKRQPLLGNAAAATTH